MNYFRCGGGRSTHTATKIDVAKTPLATFESNVSGLYIPEILAYLQASQSGTGDPSPSNPRAINGVSEVKTVNTPDSDWNELWQIDNGFKGTVNFNQLIQNGNFAVTSNWSKYGSATLSVNNNIGTVTPASSISGISQTTIIQKHKYLVACDIKLSTANATTRINFAGGALGSYFASSNTNWQSIIHIVNSTFEGSYSTTMGTTSAEDIYPFDCKNVMLIDLTQMFGSTIADYIYSLEQNEAGSGVAFFRNLYPDDYYAYTAGTTETVGGDDKIEVTTALGGTYYGGYLNVTTGLLTVDRVKTLLKDLPNSWDKLQSGTGAFYITRSLLPYTIDYSNRDTTMSNTYRYSKSGTQPNYSIRISDALYIVDDRWADTTEWQDYIDNNDVYIVYPIATPQTYQLTPAQIEQLLGENNVFCSGDVAVKYWKID